MCANLLNWLGAAADKVIPGNQQSWHPQLPNQAVNNKINQVGQQVQQAIRPVQQARIPGLGSYNVGNLYNDVVQKGMINPVIQGGQQLTNLSNATSPNAYVRSQAKPVDVRSLISNAAITGLNGASFGEAGLLMQGGKALLPRIGQGIVEGGLLGGAQGAAGTFADPRATAMDYAKNIGLGAATGGALGAAAPVVGAGARLAAGTTRDMVHAAPNILSNQEGFIASKQAAGFGKAVQQGKTYLGPDNKPRFEVSDANAKIKEQSVKQLNQQGTSTLGQLLDHKDLYKQYPDHHLDGTLVKLDPTLPHEAQYNEHTGTIHINPDKVTSTAQLRQTVLHETQHVIQGVENTARGGLPGPSDAAMVGKSPDLQAVEKQLQETSARKGALDRMYNAQRQSLGGPNTPGFADKLRKLSGQYNTPEYKKLSNDVDYFTSRRQELLDTARQDPIRQAETARYRNLTGEAEANAVEQRSGLNQRQADRNPVDPFYNRDPRTLINSDRVGVAAKAKLGPTPPKMKVSSKGMGPDEAPSRFPHRVAADPRSSESLKASMYANGSHSVLHNKDVVERTAKLIKDDEDRALSLAKRGTSTDANATALQLIDKYLKNGEFEKADELTRTVSPRFTRQGQQTQILSIYSRLTPTGAVKYASRQLEKAAESSSKSAHLEGQAAKITEGLHATNAQAAEQVAKEFSAKADAKAATRNVGGKPEKTPLTPEERLAKRIKVGATKKNGPDPITDMVNTLHKVAKQLIEETPSKKIPRDPMELIGQAVKEKGEYSRVYTEARKLVEEKYKDNPQALEELNKYFNTEANRTYAKSQLNKGVQNGLKGVDLAKLVREHYSKVNETGDALKNKLIRQAGLSEHEATQLAGDIQNRFKELTQAKKESVLNQMFKDRPTLAQKSAAQKVIEMSNLGAFDKEGIRNLAGQKLGLPSMTPELAKEITGMAEHIQSLPEGSSERNMAVAKMMRHIADQIPQSKVDNTVSIWKAGLLSGVKTQGGNFLSNGTFAGLKKAADVPSVLADKLISLGTGQRTKTLTMRGSVSGTAEGAKNAASTLKTGIDPRDIGADKYDQHSEINLKNKWLQRAIGNPANIVFRGMSAADQPFYYSALKNSLYDQAKATAINEGLHGAKLSARMDELARNPTEQMAETATQDARKAVLGHDTVASKVVSGIHQAIDHAPVPDATKTVARTFVNVIAPFTKVPSAFLSRSVDFTPLGVGREVFEQIAQKKFDQRALSTAIGEGATGTGIIALGATLAGSGLLSGDYPTTDQKEQARWKAEGITPNSVKLGGKWISLNYLGPLGMLMGAGKNWHDAEQQGTNQLAAAGIGFGQGLLNQSFVQGLSGFTDAIKNPQQFAQTFLNSQISSIVPGWMNDIANATDNMQRQTNNPLDAVKNRIPGARQTLAPKIDAFGNDLTQASGSGINTALNPLKPSTDNHTPLLNELDRLKSTGKENVVFPTPVKSIGSGQDAVRLTPEQATQRQKILGNTLTPLWNSMINSPAYAKLTDDQKANALQSALKDANAAADRTMLSQVDSSKLTKAASTRVAAVMSGKADPATYMTTASLKGSGTTVSAHLTPAQRYTANQTKYQTAKAAGTLTAPKDYATQQSLAKEAVTSKYSQDVLDFYSMSKAEENAYFKQDPATAKALYDQAKQLDAQLGGKKYKYGLGTKPKSVRSTLPKMPHITAVKAVRAKLTVPKVASRSVKKIAKLPTAKLPKVKVPKATKRYV